MNDPHDRCIRGEKLNARRLCPECDADCDTTDPAWDDPQEEGLT